MDENKIDWIDEYSEWPASAEFVARQEFCTGRTVRKWAKNNGVRTVGGGNEYLLFRQDIINFRMRERPGRRWVKDKK